MLGQAERQEQRARISSSNTIALNLFYNACNRDGLPNDESSALELIDKCIISAKVVDDVLYKEMEPFI